MDDGSVRRDMNMLQLIHLLTLLRRAHSIQQFAWVSSIYLWRSVAGTQVKDPLLGIDEVSGDVVEGGVFSMQIIVVDGPWSCGYSRTCDLFSIAFFNQVLCNWACNYLFISWFTGTFTCRCCLNMDTFYNFDTGWVGSLEPLLTLCMNTMHSNIGRKRHQRVLSISKQTPKNPWGWCIYGS